MSNPLKGIILREGATPQTAQEDPRQVMNNAGGFSFEITPLERIKRFLILGSDSSFYQPGAALTQESARTIIDYVARDSNSEHLELIDLIVEVSVAGRAPKQQPALFALALVISQTKFEDVKSYGYQQVNKVCRTGTTLFEFFSFLNQFQRFGMGARKAIARWYAARDTDNLAYQVGKYRSRSGFTHADLLRLSKKVRSGEEGMDASRTAVLNWIVGKDFDTQALPRFLQGIEKAKKLDGNDMLSLDERVKEYVNLVARYGLSWEMLPSEALASPKVWAELIESDNLPMGALVRNLGRMTANQTFENKGIRQLVARRLGDPKAVQKSRLHSLNLLVALKTYQQGHGEKGGLRWTPHYDIVNGLEQAIYLAYGNVEPSKSRMMYALDVSGSMTWENVAGAPISPFEAEAMLALVTANVEESCEIVGFSGEIVPLAIHPQMKLGEALAVMRRTPMGRTDCAAPMLYALKEGIKIDTFVVVTDNETWSGSIHPHKALQMYREATGIPAKLIVLAATATGFSIADPSDAGMLDIAGFDLATPQVISAFARGV